MSGQTPPSGACCRACGYDLRSVSSGVCPECGRGFDPADASTFDPSPGHFRRRRWRKRALVLAVAAAIVVVMAPRGYVKSSIAVTCPTCGLDRTIEGVRPMAASWAPWTYPMWSSVTDKSPSTAAGNGAGAGCTHGVTFSLAISKRWFTVRGTKSGGGLTASGGGGGGGGGSAAGSINKLPVTGASAGEVMRTVSREVATTDSFGVSVMGAAGRGGSAGSGVRPTGRPASGSRRGRGSELDLETSPMPPAPRPRR